MRAQFGIAQSGQEFFGIEDQFFGLRPWYSGGRFDDQQRIRSAVLCPSEEICLLAFFKQRLRAHEDAEVRMSGGRRTRWMCEELWHERQKLLVVIAVPRLLELQLLEQLILLNKRQNLHAPAQPRPEFCVGKG